jgi:type II secretory ATPase GspE/PulE/Tfp pilus assembly ATPase PilB-like protein
VQTIEDPVEIQIPGIRQTNICKETGITYENSINKSILRSDVDIALIGEIRSQETAKGVIELDRVGHLVFSTVHTKKTMAIIDRFREFGLQDAYIADALSVLISARLVKKVCGHCSTIKPASELDIDKKYTGRFISLTNQLSVVNRAGC